jgi:hypothetical protein
MPTPTTPDPAPQPPAAALAAPRPAPWERRPGHHIDPETLRYETHNSPHGRVLRQAKFYGDDRLAPCVPEPWEREYRPARPTRAAA